MSMHIKIILLFILLCSGAHASMAQDTYPFASATEAKRFEWLTKEIRCVVCQNQSLAESNAPLANDLRAKIYAMLLEKKSDSEIKKFLVARYGEFILFKPPLNKITLILWLFPFIGILSIFLFIYLYSQRLRLHNL